MRKTLLVSLYSACLSLAIASGIFLAFPVTTKAASCSATCSNGTSMSVPPGTYMCSCVDGGSGVDGSCAYKYYSGGTNYVIRCS
jgi:hypothetical protein